ncbi:MAG: hypothetical protein ACRCZF_00120, partial [Gemmataceae bacterium]
NDTVDIPLIQLLGCRLMAGQTSNGGWGYSTWHSSGDEARMRSAMQPKNLSVVNPGRQPDPNAPPTKPPQLHPEAQKIADAVRSGYRSPSVTRGVNSDDNSNTQFAIVGLWCAQKRGVPAYAAFKRIENRFLRSQSPSDHGWGYGHSEMSSTPSMTCAGLIGLAAAAASKPEKVEPVKPTGPPKEKRPEDEDSFFNPPASGGGTDPDIAPEPKTEEQVKEENGPRDNAIKMGLTQIGRLLKGNANAAAGPAGGGWGGVTDLYFFWSLERVGVAFGLETIGDVDWYEWGVAKILPTQQGDGSWHGSYSNEATTCFAILFLKKTNFVSDLSRALKGKVKDPGAAELRGSRGGPLGLNAAGSASAVRSPTAGGAPGAALPPGVTAVGMNPAEAIAEELVVVPEAEWLTKLRVTKESKGAQFTLGIAMAIGRL